MHGWQVTAWLNRDRLTNAQAAKLLGVAPSTLRAARYRLRGPSEALAQRIEAKAGVLPAVPEVAPLIWDTRSPGYGVAPLLSGQQVMLKRRSLGMTRYKFAAAVGVNARFIRQIEEGQRRCSDRVAMLVKGL